MKKKLVLTLTVAAFAGCISKTSDRTGNAAEPRASVLADTIDSDGRTQDLIAVRAEARVTNLDKQTRLISLKTADGGTTTFRVGDQVERLNEIEVGDMVVVDYLQSVAYELRAPTADEKRSPRLQADALVRAPKNRSAAAGGISSRRSVVTIVGIDREAETVSVRNPEGEQITVKVDRPERLKQIKVGDTVIITYTEAVAVSLKPKKLAS